MSARLPLLTLLLGLCLTVPGTLMAADRLWIAAADSTPNTAPLPRELRPFSSLLSAETGPSWTLKGKASAVLDPALLPLQLEPTPDYRIELLEITREPMRYALRCRLFFRQEAWLDFSCRLPLRRPAAVALPGDSSQKSLLLLEVR